MSVLNLEIFDIGQAVISGMIVLIPSSVQLFFQFALRNVVLGLLVGFALVIWLKTLKTSISLCKYRAYVEENEEGNNEHVRDRHERDRISSSESGSPNNTEIDETSPLYSKPKETKFHPPVEVNESQYRSTQ